MEREREVFGNARKEKLMPACPRSKIIDESEPGIYHCYNRCARQLYLMDCDSKRDWLWRLLITMASIFGIDILKYALLGNHMHLILRNRPDLVAKWSDEEVLRRAMRLFADRFERWAVNPGEPLPAELLEDQALIQEMRERLSSISWLMKIVQERFAKFCNQLDGMTGVFWDGRYRSKKLESDSAVLSCALYVDLNILRTGKVDRPENSKYSSIYDRILGLQERRLNGQGAKYDGFLVPLNVYGDYEEEDLAAEGLRASNDGILELPLEKYIEMVDAVGRLLRDDKQGAIPDHLSPIFERLGIRPEFVCELIECFDKFACRVIGTLEGIRARAEKLGVKYLKGVRQAKRFFINQPAPSN